MIETSFATAATVAALAMLLVAFSLTAACAIARSSRADRIVALDVLSLLAVGLVAVFAFDTGIAVLLDAAAVPALVGFVATAALSRSLGHDGGMS